MAKSDKKYQFIWPQDDGHRPFSYSDEDLHPSKTTDIDFSATITAINKEVDVANKKYEELENKLDKLENDTREKIEKDMSSTKSKFDQDIIKVKAQIDESKARVVETLALFVALFTFLSLQIQIFKEKQNIIDITGLILISSGLITFFVLILDIMIKTKSGAKDYYKTRFFLLLTFSLLLTTCGALLLTIWRP